MRNPSTIVTLVGFLGLWAGLCTVAALVVTVAEAWREHVVESWPEATATIGRCDVDLRFYNGPDDDDPTWWLECPIGFRAGTDPIKTTIHSGQASSRSRDYPELMNKWASDHPSGSTIIVRYDPSNPKAALPAQDHLPNGGPRSRLNLQLLLFFSAAFVFFLTIARVLRIRAKRHSTEV